MSKRSNNGCQEQSLATLSNASNMAIISGCMWKQNIMFAWNLITTGTVSRAGIKIMRVTNSVNLQKAILPSHSVFCERREMEATL
jgi:hypothetical protein